MSQRVLLVSAGMEHPNLQARRALRSALDATGCHITRISELNDLSHTDLSQVDAIVLYFHHEKLNPEALERLESYVEQGGGLLAWHSASASFMGNDRYSALLGGHFVEHGPVETFTVSPGIFKDTAPFSVQDELYRHAYDPNIHVILHTSVDGKHEPVCWLREQDQGRVFYCSLGHTASAMRHPAVRRLMELGLQWVTSRKMA